MRPPSYERSAAKPAIGTECPGLKAFAARGREAYATPLEQTGEPQLVNVVRELSLAADIPEPKVYVIEDPALNAFATGRDPEHASVAVTRGLLDRLDREELQGVVGHELAHVANYDIRFSLLVGVLVGSIALLADILARMTFWRSVSGGRRSGGNPRQQFQ